MWQVPGREGISQTGFESWRDIAGGLCGICRRGTAGIGSYVGDRFNHQHLQVLAIQGFQVCQRMRIGVLKYVPAGQDYLFWLFCRGRTVKWNTT